MAKRNKIHPLLAIISILTLFAIMYYALFGDSKKRDIIGAWVTDTAATETGFQCGVNGIAASINNSRCQYNSWELNRNRLILKGKLFQDGRVESFSDTMDIKRLSSKVLVTEQNGQTVNYRKTR